MQSYGVKFGVKRIQKWGRKQRIKRRDRKVVTKVGLFEVSC